MGRPVPGAQVWLATGSFAIGMEGLMIVGLLPAIARDLQVSVADTGVLVTVFAIAYAIGSPVLSALCAGVDRRRVLVLALLSFTLGNLFAAVTEGLWQLIAARVVLALSAGLFIPTAYAAAAGLVGPDQRGRAIAAVTGGMTVATALGAPLGLWVGAHADWRTTFLVVAGFGLVGVLGLGLGLPPRMTSRASTLAERLAVARRPAVQHALLVTFFKITAGFAFLTFIAPFLMEAADLGADGVSAMLFVFGVGAAVGNVLGGQLADRIGPLRVQLGALGGLTLSLVCLSAAAGLPARQALIAFVPLVLVLSIFNWAFNPAQIVQLIRLAPDMGTVAASLNSSALYAGMAFGSLVGAVTISWGDVRDLGWVASICSVVALAILAAAARREISRSSARTPGMTELVTETGAGGRPAHQNGLPLLPDDDRRSSAERAERWSPMSVSSVEGRNCSRSHTSIIRRILYFYL
ncbi:MFS transporter [Inquilinus sp. OTU3971]|uniref:MFS transporter n=1 Tax=Inquilinus sp. OTU3971 TaxID=3043855 RepID=UPI00313ABF5D